MKILEKNLTSSNPDIFNIFQLNLREKRFYNVSKFGDFLSVTALRKTSRFTELNIFKSKWRKVCHKGLSLIILCNLIDHTGLYVRY